MGSYRTKKPEAQPRDYAAECDRLQAELELSRQQLAASEARFRAVIERNADAIVVVDEDGVVRFANEFASQLFAQPLDRLIGSAFGFPVLAGETTELDLAGGGSARVVEMRVVESEWEGETARIASLRDVTERKHAEQSARELIREQTARAAAEQAARRFRFLADSSNLLSASLNQSDTLAQLVRLCVREIADWAVVYCRDGDDQLHRAQVAHRDPGQETLLRQFQESPLILTSDHPVHQAMATGQPQVLTLRNDGIIEALIADPGARVHARALGMASLLILPITARGRSQGALALISTRPDKGFADEEIALAENLATRAGLAIDNARLYEQARAANQTKTELLAVISHDLRTPLNSIMGYADLLHMGIPEVLSESTRERVHRIRQSAGHLLYLIDELLAFARVEGNHEEITHSQVDGTSVLRQVAELIEPLAQQKGLQLEIVTPDEPVLMLTDADKVRQILMNLVGNAVKYTEHGYIRMALHVTDEKATFTVADSGLGIAAEHLPHIFQPFWQVNRSQRSLGGGTGLGLSVVQRVVKLLGGEITVQSDVGAGSTFQVSLPLQ